MPDEATSGVKLGQVVWSRLIGKTVLVQESGQPKGNLYEYHVVNVSPSGLRVQFKNAIGRTFWTDNLQYIPLEILP